MSLATKDTLSEIPLLRNTLGTMQALYVFLEASPKRHAIFIQQGDTNFVKTLKSQSATRWTAHETSRRAVEQELHTIIKSLNEISMEKDSKVSTEATSLLRAVVNFDFLFGMSVLKLILPHTSALSSFVQGVNIDVLKVKQNADLTIETLQNTRTEENFKFIWQLTLSNSTRVKDLLEEENIDIDFIEAKLPRQRPSKRRLGNQEPNCENTVFDTVEKYNKVTHFYPALDKIINELKNRFAENDNKILCSMGKILSQERPDDEAFSVVSEFYSLDMDQLKADHKVFIHAKKQLADTTSISVMYKQMFQSKTLMMMPELSKIIKVFSVIPATSCSAERSFSSLRRLKTYLRNTMGQDRLSSLAVMTIEPSFVNRVLTEDMSDLIRAFAGNNNRHNLLF